MNGEGAFFMEVEGHGWGVETGFALYEIAETGVFYYHFCPKRVAGETKKIFALVCGDFDDDIGPAGNDVLGGFDFVGF